MKLTLFISFIYLCFTQSIPGKLETTQLFTFKDSNGVVIQNPLSGGYKALYAQVLDWNNDGIKELFFLNRGFITPFSYSQKSNNSLEFDTYTISFTGLELDRWFHFFDFDSDGDFDVVTLDSLDAITLQTNTGSNNSPFFNSHTRIRDNNNQAITTEFGNLPVLFDINDDGYKDLFITTQTDGHIIYYENKQNGTFEKVSDKYGNVAVIAKAKTSEETMHGQSSFAFVDFDRDDDYDILWGDQFQRNFYYLENTGTKDNPNYPTLDESFPPNDQLQTQKTYNYPVISDINGDGFDDIFLFPQFNNNETFHLYLGTNQFDQFQYVTSELIPTIDEGFVSALDIRDVNDDGKDDIILSTYLNTSNEFSLSFYLQQEQYNYYYSNIYSSFQVPWSGKQLGVYDFKLFDINKDTHWDIIYLDENGDLTLTLNAGTNLEPVFHTETIIKSNLGNSAQFSISDINIDGNLELVTTSSSKKIMLFTSTSSFFDTEISDDLLPNMFKRRTLIHQATNNEFIFESQKKSLRVTFKTDFSLEFESLNFSAPTIYSTNSPVLYDFNKDGIYDFSYGHENGGLIILLGSGKQSTGDKNKFPIYPNPTRSKQVFKIQEHDDVFSVQFYDILGRKINIPYKIIRNKNEVQWSFPKELSSGLYFVKINNKTYKVIKL